MSYEINPTNNEVVETHDHHKTQDISRISEQNADNENEMVNLGYIANSSRIDEQKQLRPDQVWEHFESHKGVDGTEWAICKYCMKKLVGLINTGSKHLENHLERCRKKRNIGDRGGDHNAADQAGNWSTNPIPVIEQSWMDRLSAPLKDYLEDEIRTIIKDDPTASRLHSIRADQIIQVYKKEKERFRTYLEDLSCRCCLNFDIDGNYFSCSVQFIDENWELREKMIRLTKMEEDGDICKCLKAVLFEWGIHMNISSIHDCCQLEKDRDKYVMHFNDIERWFSDRGSLPFAGKLSYFYSFRYLAFDFYRHAHSNVFDKITAIFNYVKKTSSAEQKFQIAIETAKSLGKEVTAEVIPEEEVYGVWRDKIFLEVAIGYKEAFFELENIDTEFESINFTKEQWHLIAPSFYDYFAELSDFIVLRQWSYNTANTAFVVLCELYTISLPLENFHLLFDDDESFYWFRDFMEEYWSKNNMVLAAAAVLDPRFKLEIVEHWYKKIYGSEFEKQVTLFKDYFTEVYNKYARVGSSIPITMLDLWGKPCNDLEDVPLQKAELDLYLKKFEFPSFEKFDILYWWRVNNQYFPTLAKMARDFFSIEFYSIGGSTTPFDLDNFLFKLKNNGLDFDIVGEALICTNIWLESP